MVANVTRVNWVNSALVVLTFGLALAFPFQLFFFSYAFLGPAHYLTQISWLHDKRYFSQWKCLAWALVLCAGMAVLMKGPLAVLLMGAALALALFFTLSKNPAREWPVLVLLLFTAFMCVGLPNAALFVAVLLPTIAHVFLFTGSFLLLGAMKSRTPSALVTLLLFFGLGVSFFFIPHEMLAARFDNAAFPMHDFDPIAVAVSRMFGGGGDVAALSNIFAFFSFAYTYHYLNWFSKVEIIRWHAIPRARVALIMALYLLSIGIYLYDYGLGFKLLAMLSVAHVVLEYPLNIRTFGTIYTDIRQRVRPIH